MNVQPGWYQDPEGPQGQARYWDGTQWGPSQGGPTAGYQPQGQPSEDRGPSKSSLPSWLVPVAVMTLLALAIGFFVWGQITGDDPEPTDSPTPTPNASESADPNPSGSEGEPVEVGALNCAAASSSNFPKGPELRVAGIVVPFPDAEWGFRYDSSQWTWINDLHAWGTIDIEPSDENWAAGIVAGRLEAGNGFGDPEQAAEATVECLTTYGPFNTGAEMEVTSSEAVTIDGMSGWQMELAFPEEGQYGHTVLHVITLDAGQAGNLATVIGFHPNGESGTESMVQDALANITSQ